MIASSSNSRFNAPIAVPLSLFRGDCAMVLISALSSGCLDIVLLMPLWSYTCLHPIVFMPVSSHWLCYTILIISELLSHCLPGVVAITSLPFYSRHFVIIFASLALRSRTVIVTLSCSLAIFASECHSNVDLYRRGCILFTPEARKLFIDCWRRCIFKVHQQRVRLFAV